MLRASGTSRSRPRRVAAAARRRPLEVELTAGGARADGRAPHRTADARRRPSARVYGRTTGVGANRDVEVDGDAAREHSVRLLRSHAGGLGEPLAAEVVRGTMLVRLTQMAAGRRRAPRRGRRRADRAAARRRRCPSCATSAGSAPATSRVLAPARARARRRGLEIEAGDALPLMSSNAATFASRGARVARRAPSCSTPASASPRSRSTRCEGNPEAFAAPVAAARPLAGLVAVSARAARAHRRRAAPRRGSRTRSACAACRRSAGALDEAVAALHDVLAVEINAARREPAGGRRGGPPPRRLPRRDVRARARRRCGSRSSRSRASPRARLTHLMAPELTGLPPFLPSTRRAARAC